MARKRKNNLNQNDESINNAQYECEKDSSGNAISVRGNPVSESGNRYLYTGGENKPKQITNFIMRPINAIESDTAYLLDIEFTLADGRKFVRQINSAAFVSAQKFKTEIKKIAGIDMVFDGTESNLSDIQQFMCNKYRNYNHCDGISYVGLHKQNGEWVYVGTDAAIDKKGKRIESIVSVLEDNDALKSGIIDADMINRRELQEISRDLFRFNTYERTINIIGWVCVCFLKERLRQRKIKLSHLVIAGGAGSGKSETLEKIIQPIFSLVGSGIGCSGITKFSTLKSTSSTNLLPVIFEEYKPHKLTKIELDLISGMLRSTYDYQTSQRGRADQSVVNYLRRSPIILVGESSFDETAIKERIIDVQFAKSDRMDEHTKSYRALSKQEKALNGLGKALLLLSMNIPDEDLDKLIAQSKVFEDLDFENRVILGISNVKLGILLLKDLYASFHLDFEDLTGVTDQLVYNSLVNNTMNALDGSSKVNSAVDLTIQVFDTMALKCRIRKDYEYIVDESNNELCLRTNLIYDEFTKYIREFNISDVEVLASRQFTKQLKKEKYFVGYLVRGFKTGSSENSDTVRQKCFVLDLVKLNQVCNLEAFRCDDTGYAVDEDGFMQLNEDNQIGIPFMDQ